MQAGADIGTRLRQLVGAGGDAKLQLRVGDARHLRLHAGIGLQRRQGQQRRVDMHGMAAGAEGNRAAEHLGMQAGVGRRGVRELNLRGEVTVADQPAREHRPGGHVQLMRVARQRPVPRGPGHARHARRFDQAGAANIVGQHFIAYALQDGVAHGWRGQHHIAHLGIVARHERGPGAQPDMRIAGGLA
ncbi:hypothetical protein D3C81_1299200 [compost metagenome]